MFKVYGKKNKELLKVYNGCTIQCLNVCSSKCGVVCRAKCSSVCSPHDCHSDGCMVNN